MGMSSLIYVYSLTCLSVVGSLLLAGFAIAPAFTFFERKTNAETARRRSLLVAFVIWVLLQVVACLLIFILNKEYLM